MGSIANCFAGAVPARPSGCLEIAMQHYRTANEMQQSTCLRVGYAHTLGFESVGDGRGSYYVVEASGTPDGDTVLGCFAGMVARTVETVDD